MSYCAACDGFFFRDRKAAVVGRGENALEEALLLARSASEVMVVHRRGRFSASGWLLGKARENPRISFLMDAAVAEVLGEPINKILGGVVILLGVYLARRR